MKLRQLLIADDNHDLRRRVIDYLQTTDMQIGEISEASDGNQAVQMALELLPDIILMDVRMPEKNGIEAAKEIKTQQPDLKIIILSAYDIKEYKNAAYQCGVDAYVVKKRLLSELIPAIERISAPVGEGSGSHGTA
ncbi:MAG: response regulator [Anaerolineae bacterium]|nr:response regulator [Anaerolineae bacterium]